MSKRKTAIGVMILIFSGCIAGCGGEKNVSPGRANVKVYDGNTTIHTRYGSWTPPKGSRRTENGNIVDSEGCVIGNDGTFRDTGKGVG